MQGNLPALGDFGFKIDGRQFHIGPWFNEDNGFLVFVAEKVAGKGAYSGTGAVYTWDLVDRLEFMHEKKDSAAALAELAAYIPTANEKLAEFLGVPVEEVPKDYAGALLHYIKNRLQFRPETNQIVLV